MTKEDFMRQINKLVPWPDSETSSALFAFGRELGHESGCDGAQDLLNSLSFISRHFGTETAQSAYEIIQYGAALPGEMVAAAFHMAGGLGCSPRQAAQMARDGEFMCFYEPKNAEELSPLAVCSVEENGKLLTCYTMHFGDFDPETALRSAQQYSCDRRISVTDALLLLTTDMKLDAKAAGKNILVCGDENMTRAMAGCFDRCPALAARLAFDVDRGSAEVEYNPLWLELRQQQEPIHGGMGLTM